MKTSTGEDMNAESGYFALYGRGRLAELALEGMLNTAMERGSDWMVTPINHKGNLRDSSLQGLVAAGWLFDSGTKLPERFPVLNISNRVGPRPGVGNFLSDDAAIGRMAAEFFHARGIRQLLVMGIEGLTVHGERAEAAAARAESLGLRVSVFTHDFRVLGAELGGFEAYTQAMRELLRPVFHAHPLGGGVFCTNDWLGIQVLRVFQRDFPEHLDASPVLGVDNDAQKSTYYGTKLPGLSSIEPAFERMGREAFLWLNEHPGKKGLAALDTAQRRFPPARLVERASTVAGSCADPMTARMIRWAWERIQSEEKVTVSEMARVHGMHVKTLERKFQEHAGCNAVDLLVRYKLNFAKSLLRETILPISEIALRAGYSKQDVFARAMRNAENCTPREYRLRKTIRSVHADPQPEEHR